MTKRSTFYGKPVSQNAFPGYTTNELLRDLSSPSLDDAARAKIEAEVARRHPDPMFPFATCRHRTTD
jgi:hypothetical protein